MTKEQKTLILYYREQHLTYRQIGEKLGLSPDTVKTFCRRNGLQADAVKGNAGIQCKNCGAPIQSLPGKRKRLFCSPACRTANWRKHNLLGQIPRHCAGCGALLTGGNASKKYCSHACYIRHRFATSSVPPVPLKGAAVSQKETIPSTPAVPMLTKEQFERELNYRAAFSITKQMLEEGLITPKEFVQIDTFLREKFSPIWGGLYQKLS